MHIIQKDEMLSGSCDVACGLLCSETRPPPFYKARMFLGALAFLQLVFSPCFVASVNFGENG